MVAHENLRPGLRYFLGRRRSLGEGRGRPPYWATGGPAAVAFGRRQAGRGDDVMAEDATPLVEALLAIIDAARAPRCKGWIGAAAARTAL